MAPTTVRPRQIMIVDDHELVRRGVRAVIAEVPEWEVCGEASTGPAAVELAVEKQPDLAIIDIALPLLSGVEVIHRIRRARLPTEVIIFSGNESEDLVREVLAAGARSFLLKTDGSAHMRAAVQAALDHKPYLTPRVSEILFQRLTHMHNGGDKPLENSALTARERETVLLLAEGRTNKELAVCLGVSIRTAEGHRASIMKKLGLRTVTDLVRYAIRNGIISP